MLDWNEAQATCEAHGKRLCWASEWTAACEGPERTRLSLTGGRAITIECNIDNFYIEPKRFGPKGGFYFESKDPGIRARELARLDQSVPSGSMESCKSGFGVYDMTGNFDEWVTSDVAPREASHWAGLKGGCVGPRPQPVPSDDV
jgi:sulfatase modifying factor 1